MDVSQTLVFKASFAKMLGLLFLSLGTTVAGFALAWRILPNVRQGSLAEFVGWILMLLGAAATLCSLYRILGPHKLFLTVSPAGFQHSALSSRIISWREVKGLGAWVHRGQEALIVKVDESTWETGGISRITRWTRGVDLKFGIDGLAVRFVGLPIRFDDGARLFEAYARAHGGKVE